MHVFLTFLPLLTFVLFESDLENAFTFLRNGEWNRAAVSLDDAALESPELFEANNLPYLRGRIAENQQDWERARLEFSKIAPDNPLRPLATWHAARAAIRLNDQEGAIALLAGLPLDFAAEMKMQLAAEAPPDVALTIYQGLTTRDARLNYALARNDHLTLWALLRELNADDVGLQAARALAPRTLSPRDSLDLAEAFLAHRQFADAIRFYQSAAVDTGLKAQSDFQVARAHFLSENYRGALEAFNAVATDFAGSDWQKDAEYQAASCYWRLGEYQNAEKAYSDYITRYGGIVRNEGAVRNLIDVYRILGDNTKARSWLDRALATRLTAATRQSLLFTKAKVLFIQDQYSSALTIFRQLGTARIRSTPGGTTRSEVRYYEALTLSRLGRTTAAKVIWKQLAKDPLTYYGQKAAERLGETPLTATTLSPCEGASEYAESMRKRAEDSLNSRRRPVLTETLPKTDALGELLFLQLWDEASLLMDRQSRPDLRVAAELAYLGGRHHRAIQYADRLPKSDSRTRELLYPAGFRETICRNAAIYGVDPLWLHAIIWQESKYNPLARSGASARGLMQFIPDTAAVVAAAVGAEPFSVDMLYDPAVNLRLGAHYWASLMKEFQQPELALAAYNGGPDNVRRWKGKWPDGDAEFFVADIGFIETKNYVMAVFGARAAYGNR